MTAHDDSVVYDGGDAAEIRKSAALQRAELARQTAALRAQQGAAKAEIDAQRAALAAELARRTAEIEAQMKPLRERLAKAEEVLWTVDLYLGRDETLRLVRDGSPAPADVPIVIRQRVLVMAEESLVLLDDPSGTGMDYRDIDTFVRWLTESDAHLDRVMPMQKGVVVLVPTRVPVASGNVFEDAARNRANQSSYWLLRNGQRLHLLTVDDELSVTDRVFPRRREFLDVFDQRLFGSYRTTPLEPGSKEWLKLEKKADARRRHYMRIMMVLQGIIDRTTVWQPTFPAGVNLLSVTAQDDGKVVLLEDDDDSIALADGRESFGDYQRRLNKLLRPGLRVIGDWNRHRSGGEMPFPRVTPEFAKGLSATTPYLIEDRRDGGLVIRFERTDQTWNTRYRQASVPARRASYVLYPDDAWVLPYDLVTVADLERYLASRDERSEHFLTMVPTIKAALAAKHAEAHQEAPFRVLLRQLLVTQGADQESVDQVLDELVQWWKVKNTWCKPLNGAPEHEAAAVRAITAEYASRRAVAATTDVTERMVAAGRRLPGAICVARKRSGQWFAYTPSTDDEDVFVDVTPIRADGTLGTTDRWTSLRQRSVTLLHVAWSTPRWDNWNFAANPNHYLTGPERDSLIDDIRRQAPGLPLVVVEFHNPATPSERGLASYSWTHGTPETAPLRTTADPLSWHYEHGDDRMITMRPYRVTKTGRGSVRLEPGNVTNGYADAFRPDWARFSASSEYGNIPWWPDDAHRYRDPRPRLVWSDVEALDRMNVWRKACIDAATAEKRRRQEISAQAYRYVDVVTARILDDLTSQARARFLDDYGQAEDLWDTHLPSLELRCPIHARTLWGIIAQRLARDESPIGATLTELAQEAYEHGNRAPGEWHPTPGPQNLFGYGDLIVPDPDDHDIASHQRVPRPPSGW